MSVYTLNAQVCPPMNPNDTLKNIAPLTQNITKCHERVLIMTKKCFLVAFQHNFKDNRTILILIQISVSRLLTLHGLRLPTTVQHYYFQRCNCKHIYPNGVVTALAKHLEHIFMRNPETVERLCFTLTNKSDHLPSNTILEICNLHGTGQHRIVMVMHFFFHTSLDCVIFTYYTLHDK